MNPSVECWDLDTRSGLLRSLLPYVSGIVLAFVRPPSIGATSPVSGRLPVRVLDRPGSNAMSEISDAAVIEMLRRQLSFAAAKQAVAASNIANFSTPGYRAREADFGSALDDALMGRTDLTRTNPSHLAGRQTDTSVIREVDGLPARRDGNTVQIDRELLRLGKATAEFAQAQTALAAKFRLIRYAITEGR